MYNKIINIIRILSAILGPYKKRTYFLIVLMILIAILETFSIGMMLPLVGAIINSETYYGQSDSINHFIELFISIFPSNQSKLLSITILFLFVIILKNLFIYFNSLAQQHYLLILRKYWSTNVFSKYIKANYTYLMLQKRGSMINNIFNETMVASKFMSNIITIISKITIVIFLIIFMLFIDWKITAITCLTVILFGFIFSYFTNNQAKVVGQKRQLIMQKITAHSEHSLNAIRQVKLFNLENKVVDDFKKKINHWKNLSFKIQLIRNIPIPLGEILIIGIFTSLIFFADLNDDYEMTSFIPLMGFIMFSLQKLYQNAALLLSQGTMLLSYIPGIKLVNNIIDNDTVKTEKISGAKINEINNSSIQLKKLSYTINSNKIFDEIDITFNKGSITGITGESGSGKSTIADLLSGLIQDYSGKILINNDDIKNLDISSLRKMIAFVSQDSFLFNSSIKDNIKIVNDSLSDEEIIKFAKQAQAYEFIIKQKDKFETIVEDRGLSLSGGERQRLTIARAFACNADILVFDEGLSAIDEKIKYNILEQLKKLKKEGKIIVIISHQIKTLEIADNIYTIDNCKLKTINSVL
jgi:ABC-type multidrug transport system fused ATPase/permease subunit